MSEKEKNEKWFEHYSKYGIAFIAPQMQAIVKRAFFEGMVAAEQSVQADETICTCSHDAYENVVNPGHCMACGKPFRR